MSFAFTDMVSDPKLKRAIDDFIDNKREPVWDADDEDGQWCYPENQANELIRRIIEHYERKTNWKAE